MTRLGIDIGGSGIKGALVNIQSGELVTERERIPTPQPSKPEAVAEVVGTLARHFDYQGPIGCTFPAIIKRGVAHSAANVDDAWIGTDAASLFSSACNAPVTVINDADAAGLAEMRFGAGKDKLGVVIVLTFGTGIGSALFIDGTLVPNSELGHLEIGSTVAEHWASDKIRKDEDLSWKKWSKRVSSYLQHLERLFSPDLFVFSGGVSKKSDKWLSRLEISTPGVPAEFLNDAGIVGAALLAAQNAS